MFDPISILFLLILGHFICDYPLQGEFLAKAKNPFEQLPGVPWGWAMSAHCFIHSGAVFLITGSLFLALLEFVVHFLTDVTKCNKSLSFHEDQSIHLGTKIGIWIIWCSGILG